MDYFAFGLAQMGGRAQDEIFRNSYGNGFDGNKRETNCDSSETSGEFEDEMTPVPNMQKNDNNIGNPYTTKLVSTEQDMHQQNSISHFPSSQHQQRNPFNQLPLPVTSHIDLRVTNNSLAFTSTTQQPQHLSQLQDGPRHNNESIQPQEFESRTFSGDSQQDHNRLREQQHSIDVLMAKELNQLSFRQRNEINEEIHGVSSLYFVEETNELIARSLENLRLEIEHNIPTHRKVAYDRSKQIDKRNRQIREQHQSSIPVCNSSKVNSGNNGGTSTRSNGYVNDPDFLLLFLRRDLFTIKKAALRLVSFMELVYELWGERALSEKVWQSQGNLSLFELNFFRTGIFQCLQGRDRAGRRILGNFADDKSDLSVQSRLRLSMYCIMAILEDVETQKKGAVGVTMWHNVSMDDFQKRGQCHKRISEAIPIRFSAIHFCIPHENQSNPVDLTAKNTLRTANPQILRLLKTMFVVSIGAELRPRLRVHIGSNIECMYVLQSFGILSEQIPINTTTGKVKTKQHLKWMDLKLQQEKLLKENKAFNKIECPMIKDVLFGRGWPIMKHPGNVILRNIIDSKLEEYKNEKTKRGKTMIAYSVVCMVKQKENGGRFLKEDFGWWVEVSNEMARQKVSIAFRDARKLKSNQRCSNGHDLYGRGNASTSKTSMRSDTTGNHCNLKRTGDMVSEEKDSEPENDSSTSAFLGMDGITGIKRQRCFEKRIRQKQ